MKSAIFSALIVLLISSTAFSQDTNYGVIAGANYSSWRGDLREFVGIEGRVAYNFGVFVEFPINDIISISP